MSSHLYVYVGPFFLVPKVKLQVKVQNRCCSNPACGRPATTPRDKFCGYCGYPISTETGEATVERYPRPDLLDGDWGDVVSVAQLENGVQVWLPNQHSYGASYSDYGTNSVLLLQPIDLQNMTEKFKRDYMDIAGAFHAKFGVELVDSFGAVPYHD